MSDHGISRGWDDAHALSGAYAVDALDAEERTRFESHLAVCPTCHDEVQELQATAAVLGTAAGAVPPPSLRAEVLAGIAAIRPLPPADNDRRDFGNDDSDTSGGSAARPISLEAHRQRRLLRRPLMMVAAAAAALAVGVTGWDQVRDDRPAGQEQSDLTAAERVLAAPDAVRVDKSFPDGSKAAVVVSRKVGKAVIITDGMKPAPNGHAYEIWYQSSAGDMVRAGLMPDIRSNTLVLEGDPGRAVGIGITVEPEGGSQQPSTDPIAYFNLEA